MHILINRAVLERVSNFKFLHVHITLRQSLGLPVRDTLSVSCGNTRSLDWLLNILTNFYHCTIESILTGCITIWSGGCSAHSLKSLQKALRTAEPITGYRLTCIQDINWTWCLKKAKKNQRFFRLSTE